MHFIGQLGLDSGGRITIKFRQNRSIHCIDIAISQVFKMAVVIGNFRCKNHLVMCGAFWDHLQRVLGGLHRYSGKLGIRSDNPRSLVGSRYNLARCVVFGR